MREGSASLNSDHDISLLLDGVRRNQHKSKHQVESLDVNDVSVIAATLSQSFKWQEHQLGVMIALGFLTIMRLGELQRVRRRGVRVVCKTGGERALSDFVYLPRVNEVNGLLIHLVWCKSTQEVDAWVPLSCETTIQRLLNHEQTLRKLRCYRIGCFLASVVDLAGLPMFVITMELHSSVMVCVGVYEKCVVCHSRSRAFTVVTACELAEATLCEG